MNCDFSKTFFSAACLFVSGSALSQTVIVEDFEGGALEAIDPFFDFDFSGFEDSAMITENFPGDSDSLFISSSGDIALPVTFNLQPGQLVTEAQIDVSDASGSGRVTQVRFIGTLGEVTFDRAFDLVNPFETFSTEGTGIGNITSIELVPNAESNFDNLSVTVVPEPASLALISFSGLWFLTRRR